MMGRLGGIPDLIIKNIEDRFIQQNFFRIQKFLSEFPLFRGNWTFFEFEFDGAVTDKALQHGLDFIPTDIIQTQIIGPGAITWNYQDFDRTNLYVTTTGACSVRAFIGAYREIQGG